VATGRERCLLPGRAHSVAFASGGRLVLAGDGSVGVWDWYQGRELRNLRGHCGSVNAVTVGPSGKLAASAGYDTTALVWSLGAPARAPGRALNDRELEALWAGLASEDGRRAHRACAGLVAAPASAVPFLAKRLRPAAPVGPRLARLLAALDGADFAEREAASAELAGLGRQAELAVRRALAARPSLEAHRRLEAVLAKLEVRAPAADEVRVGRAMEVLESIGSAEARGVLRAMAGGAVEAWLTVDARAALARLEKE
jgi:hypothetical protein